MTFSLADVRLLDEVIAGVTQETGVIMDRGQAEQFLWESGLQCVLEDAGRCEIARRKAMAEALTRQLLGEDWPDQGTASLSFYRRLQAAARATGYEVWQDDEPCWWKELRRWWASILSGRKGV